MSESGRVLIANDSPATDAKLAGLLASRGYQVDILADGRIARDRLRADPPDVLIVDAMLPFVDGFLLIDEYLKARNGEPGIIILITVLGSDGEPLRGWNHPIDGYIMQPYDPWQVILTLEQALRSPARLPPACGRPASQRAMPNE